MLPRLNLDYCSETFTLPQDIPDRDNIKGVEGKNNSRHMEKSRHYLDP